MNLQSLHWLTGKTLSTLSQNKAFKILLIDDSGIDIYVFSTGQERHITKKEIKIAWDYLTSQGSITGVDILNKIPSRSSAYIAAIFSKLDKVTYSLHPIRLYYEKS